MARSIPKDLHLFVIDSEEATKIGSLADMFLQSLFLGKDGESNIHELWFLQASAF